MRNTISTQHIKYISLECVIKAGFCTKFQLQIIFTLRFDTTARHRPISVHQNISDIQQCNSV